MTTTITREERERVAKLLGFGPGTSEFGQLGGGYGVDDTSILREDIDRVAQALRDAAPQWREVTETEPAIGQSGLFLREGCEPTWGTRVDWGFCCVDGDSFVRSPGDGWPWPWAWMPLPAPPEKKPAPAPAPRPIAQPGASEAARIEALERTVAELALAVERLGGGAK